MPLASMTGFARADGGDEVQSWVWELKSVNGRGLDIRCRVPNGMDAVDAMARAAAAKRLARGNVSLNLQTTRGEGGAEYKINRDLLETYAEVAGDFADRPGIVPASVDGLMALRGVIESVEPEENEAGAQARQSAILKSLDTALGDLLKSREEEGVRIAAVLEEQINDIESLTAAARALASAQPEAIKARLAEQVAAVVEAGSDADPDRIAQEAAILAVKSDIREEIDRLDAHVASARELLAEGGVVGRRLDFLAQEFNREANTLCSKAPDNEMTRIGLDLKTVIDRLREQVQNIE